MTKIEKPSTKSLSRIRETTLSPLSWVFVNFVRFSLRVVLNQKEYSLKVEFLSILCGNFLYANLTYQPSSSSGIFFDATFLLLTRHTFKWRSQTVFYLPLLNKNKAKHAYWLILFVVRLTFYYLRSTNEMQWT